MLGKQKIAVAVIALVVVAALGYAGFRLFGGVSYAEGYLYEDENRLLYATVAPSGDQVNVEVREARVETEDSIPVVKNNTLSFTGSIEGSELHLKAQSDQPLDAKVSGDELIFLGPLTAGEPGGMRLAASQTAAYKEKLDAMTARVNLHAEQKKKEVAEKKAKEEARVQFAKKVERTTKLIADLVENSKYLTDLDFTEEAASYNEQIVELQGLLDEMKNYAAQPGLKEMEFQVMQETAGSMKVLLDGLKVIDDNISSKQSRMNSIMEVLETDLVDTKTSWEEIKDAVPDAANRMKAYDEAVKTASQAVEQAKKRMVSIQKEQTDKKQQAAALYQTAVGLVNQTKAKHHF